MRIQSRLVRALAVAICVALWAVTGASASGVQRHAPPRGARTIHVAGAAATAPHGTLTGLASGTSGLLRSFDAVGSRQSGLTNFGAEFEPPDQGLCVGNGYVVEMVNSAWQVFSSNGRALTRGQNVNAPFGDGFRQFTSDPRCTYDPATNTWFATILFLNDTFTRGRLDIAVNTSGDPTTSWRHVRIDTTDLGGNGCPCFGDQPRIGIDAHNLYVTTDEFSINEPVFNGAQLYAISKSDLVAGDSTPHFAHLGLRVDGDVAFGVQPALTYGPAGAEYMMSSLDPVNAGDNRLAVWALTHVDRVDRGGQPSLSVRIIHSESYSMPPAAREKGGRSLDSGDDRMQQVEYVSGNLWGELGTAFQPPGAAKPRAAIAWFDVAVTPGANGPVADASVARQGYLSLSGHDLTYPALQADAAGNAAVGFTVSSHASYPSTGYSLLGAGSSDFGPVVVTGVGTGPYDPKATRWGDYGWAALEAGTNHVWLANEYIPPLSSQTADGRRNWGTRITEVSLP
ncbi:MAG: hypothetical protein QOF08_2713 [Gaiellales bacterium]|nr:hypothetical protein [Gaiellales bacterium]